MANHSLGGGDEGPNMSNHSLGGGDEGPNMGVRDQTCQTRGWVTKHANHSLGMG